MVSNYKTPTLGEYALGLHVSQEDMQSPNLNAAVTRLHAALNEAYRTLTPSQKRAFFDQIMKTGYELQDLMIKGNPELRSERDALLALGLETLVRQR